jgi:hypothetical protein
MTYSKPIYFKQPDYAIKHSYVRYKQGYTEIPMGQYKGELLKDVPLDYIKWAIDNITDKMMVALFQTEIVRREKRVERDSKIEEDAQVIKNKKRRASRKYFKQLKRV